MIKIIKNIILLLCIAVIIYLLFGFYKFKKEVSNIKDQAVGIGTYSADFLIEKGEETKDVFSDILEQQKDLLKNVVEKEKEEAKEKTKESIKETGRNLWNSAGDFIFGEKEEELEE